MDAVTAGPTRGPGTDEVDSSEMLGLRTVSATALVVGLTVVMILGIAETAPQATGLVVQCAVALTITVATLIVFRWRGARLPTRAAATATGLMVAVAVAAVWIHGPEPRLITMVWVGTGLIVPQTFLAARGRPAWAVSSFAVVALISVAGVTAHGGEVAGVVSHQVGQLPLLLMAIVFGVAIARRARDITAMRSRARLNIDEQAAAVAALMARDQRRGWIRATAGPTLERIALGDDFTGPEVLDVTVLEAHIRDTIRAPGLTGAELDDDVAQARRRGVTVILLDDRGTRDEERSVSHRARAVTAQRLRAARSGRLVVRLLPAGREAVLTFAGDASPGKRAYTAEELSKGTGDGAAGAPDGQPAGAGEQADASGG